MDYHVPTDRPTRFGVVGLGQIQGDVVQIGITDPAGNTVELRQDRPTAP